MTPVGVHPDEGSCLVHAATQRNKKSTRFWSHSNNRMPYRCTESMITRTPPDAVVLIRRLDSPRYPSGSCLEPPRPSLLERPR